MKIERIREKGEMTKRIKLLKLRIVDTKGKEIKIKKRKIKTVKD